MEPEAITINANYPKTEVKKLRLSHTFISVALVFTHFKFVRRRSVHVCICVSVCACECLHVCVVYVKHTIVVIPSQAAAATAPAAAKKRKIKLKKNSPLPQHTHLTSRALPFPSSPLLYPMGPPFLPPSSLHPAALIGRHAVRRQM